MKRYFIKLLKYMSSRRPLMYTTDCRGSNVLDFEKSTLGEVKMHGVFLLSHLFLYTIFWMSLSIIYNFKNNKFL